MLAPYYVCLCRREQQRTTGLCLCFKSSDTTYSFPNTARVLVLVQEEYEQFRTWTAKNNPQGKGDDKKEKKEGDKKDKKEGAKKKK